MVFGSINQVESLEKHVPSLLIVTGVLYVLAAVNTGIVFVNAGYEYETVSSPLLLLGLLASFLALIGISSRALERSPGLAKVTSIVTSLALLMVVALLVLGIGEELGVIASTPVPVALVGLFSFILSFTLAGVTVLRSSIYGQLVGGLLIAEAVALVLVFVIPVVVYQGSAPEEATIGIELTQALIVLWAGLHIRGGTEYKRQETAVET